MSSLLCKLRGIIPTRRIGRNSMSSCSQCQDLPPGTGTPQFRSIAMDGGITPEMMDMDRGGIVRVSIRDLGNPEFQNAAKWAVDQFNAKYNPKIELMMVVGARRQPVAGYLYWLDLKVKGVEDKLPPLVYTASVWETPSGEYLPGS